MTELESYLSARTAGSSRASSRRDRSNRNGIPPRRAASGTRCLSAPSAALPTRAPARARRPPFPAIARRSARHSPSGRGESPGRLRPRVRRFRLQPRRPPRPPTHRGGRARPAVHPARFEHRFKADWVVPGIVLSGTCDRIDLSPTAASRSSWTTSAAAGVSTARARCISRSRSTRSWPAASSAPSRRAAHISA